MKLTNYNKKYIFLLIINLLLFGILLSINPLQVSADDDSTERKTIRVAYYEAGKMMYGARNNVLKSGYVYDYLQQISYIANWKYEYVYGTYDELYARFLDGDIDLFPYLSYSEERKKYMFFPRLPMGEEQFFLAISEENRDKILNTPESVSGCKIGLQTDAIQNSFLEKYLKTNEIDAELVYFSTSEEQARALRNGKIDISYEASLLSQDDFFFLQKITSQPFYCTVSARRPELLNELNMAAEALQELDPNFISNLSIKYFAGTATQKALTDDEKNWLSQHSVLRVGGLAGNSPYSYMSDNDTVVGSVPEILRLMLSRISADINIEWSLYPTYSALHEALDNHEIDLIMPEYHSFAEAEKNNILISDSLIPLGMGLLYLGTKEARTINEISIYNSHLNEYYVHEYYPDAVILTCDSVTESIDAVLEHRSVGALSPLSELEKASDLFSDNYPITIIPLYRTCDLCFAARPEDHALIKLLNHSMPLINESEINYITMNYSGNSETLISASEFFKRNPEYIILAFILLATIIVGIFRIIQIAKSKKEIEQIYSQAILKNAYSYFKVNLNKNTVVPPIIEKVDGVPVDYTNKFGDTLPPFETVMSEGADKFVDDDYKESYKQFFSCSYLIESFNHGEVMPEYFCKIYSSILGWHYRRYSAFLSQFKDGNIHAMIVGYDVTTELEAAREKKELVEAREVARQTSFISAVAEDFSLVGLFRKSEETISVIHSSNDFQKQLMLLKGTKLNLNELWDMIPKLSHPDDLNDLKIKIKYDYIREKLKSSKIFKFDTRLIINGSELYFRVKFSRVENDEDSLIIALINVDDQIRREQEHGKLEGYKRAQTFADTFLQSYVSAYYVDLNDYSRIIFHKSDSLDDLYSEDKNYLDDIISFIMTHVHVEDRAEMLEAVNPKNIRARLKKENMYNVYMRDISDKTTRWFRLDVTRGTDEDHVGISFTDVTDKMAEEDQRRQAMLAAQNKAETSNNAKTAFLFNMSHDIRTPMNAIMGFTTMAKKYIDSPERVSDYLNKIDVSSHQLLSLINEVLEMSRIESGKIEFVEEPVDILEHIRQIITVVESQASEKGLKFRYAFNNITHNRIYADKTRISKIVLNIISNAIKYTPSGGFVDFTLEEIPCGAPGYTSIVIAVADTGIGMSESFVKKMFEPFTREQTSTVSKIQGTGLGMSIVKNLVDMMSGNIHVESKPGGGTRIDVTLSFRLCDEKPVPVPAKAHVSANILDGKRVLLVEDNELNREIACDLLSEHGLIIDEADDGDVAIDLIRKMIDSGNYNFYDFILMDVQMPKMDGYTASTAIRSICKPYGIKIPIIATTANAFEEDRTKALEAGMNEHVAKPLDIDRLIEILEKLI